MRATIDAELKAVRTGWTPEKGDTKELVLVGDGASLVLDYPFKGTPQTLFKNLKRWRITVETEEET